MTDEVHIHAHGSVGHISLNRPKAIHSLTLAMCEAMDMGIEGLHTETGAGVLEAAP